QRLPGWVDVDACRHHRADANAWVDRRPATGVIAVLIDGDLRCAHAPARRSACACRALALIIYASIENIPFGEVGIRTRVGTGTVALVGDAQTEPGERIFLNTDNVRDT